jgi:hypothetical protein
MDVNKKSIKSDLAKVDRMKDSEIDYSDIPPLDKSFHTKATQAWPRPNSYQTCINRILRAAMENQPPRRSRATPVPKKNVRPRRHLRPA